MNDRQTLRRRTHRMRVLVLLPSWSPLPAAGAFITTREYALGLAAAGHIVDVVTTSKDNWEPYTEAGVRVWPLRRWRHAARVSAPQVLISHHGDRRGARIVAQTPGVPHLLMVHGLSDDRDLGRPSTAWFPSQACRDHYPDIGVRPLVLPPPITPARYRTQPGRLITVNGTTAAKGADVVAAVAERMPDRQFLAVRTPWHEGVLLPDNVNVIDRTDPRSLYARTRLLLMPSQTESWGRVGVEAMLSGIPVIAAPLPGIREALGTAATYVDRDDTSRWAEEIQRLDAPDAYTAAAARAREHTNDLDPAARLAAFERACRRLLQQPAKRSTTAVRHSTAAPARPAPASTTPRQPDVVAWVHFGVPYRRAGSETMLHTMMRTLHDAGVPVRVLCSAMPEAPPSWHTDGVPYASVGAQTAEAFIRSARPHLVVSHHDYATRAVHLARDIGSRSVLLAHSDFDLVAEPLLAGPDLCVYNTHWVQASLTARYPQIDRVRSLVVHPPVVPAEHRTHRAGDHVALVNLNRDKGVDTWRAAARALPHLPFLGVTGAHGPQVLRPVRRNTRIIPQTSDMRRDVWARTRVLLVPSIYESFGMAAVEALASGIPVIAHPTPGLREALGDAARFIDRADTALWADAIRELYPDGSQRAQASAAARARSRALAAESRTEMAVWMDAVRDILSTTCAR
ncbi:glycosyltransferase family 4 protein [Streptomyces sp. NA04227]|uniref:glycosyltransferase family 4 protein n=1 Tax=Streptomyces sp. NA04227 TaxID=2742136 RepID=UPI001591D888|nr:glycosyltransferase family 4 protein [Streptomyces sp. NA04227]QKW06934.1 glycosyltransferase family 4 protein [Streptomyces sp. NA04227]